jgi:hypothetical protein
MAGERRMSTTRASLPAMAGAAARFPVLVSIGTLLPGLLALMARARRPAF